MIVWIKYPPCIMHIDRERFHFNTTIAWVLLKIVLWPLTPTRDSPQFAIDHVHGQIGYFGYGNPVYIWTIGTYSFTMFTRHGCQYLGKIDVLKQCLKLPSKCFQNDENPKASWTPTRGPKAGPWTPPVCSCTLRTRFGVLRQLFKFYVKLTQQQNLQHAPSHLILVKRNKV